MVSPAEEHAAGGQQTEDQRGYSHTNSHQTSRRLAKVKHSSGAVTHWKPELKAISEDSPMSELDRSGFNRRPAGIDERKTVKVKPRSPAKAAPPPSHAEDYWKSSATMAIPAFAPTSFLF